MNVGKVFLVGAGPGDPGLVTVKALELLSNAEVVVYDRLLDARLLEKAPEGAELIDVGKSASQHTMKQSEINSLLVAKAKEGKMVVRLKGGDPFVFGRGGEEAETLVDFGIPFEVVPGVSAAMAVPAYAGIPVTHRSFASSVAVITGHEDPTKDESSIAWDRIATGSDTLVFLMGVGNLSEIARQLVKNGRPAQTPVAVIRNGTSPNQETVVGTLADIAVKAQEKEIRPPAVIVVGEVVRMRERLCWFDCKPLFGRRVLVTRARNQASKLSELLSQHGAEPIEMPTIQIEPLADYGKLDKAIQDLSKYQWLIFTSANGVEPFFCRLQKIGKDARHLKGVQVCAIGPATAEALQKHGIKPDYVPQEYAAQGIIASFRKLQTQDKRILIPRAEQVTQELVDGLAALGAKVEQIAVYRTVLPGETAAKGKRMLIDGRIDIVTFTSSSTARNLVAMLGKDAQALRSTAIACIGQVTAQTARELGLKVDLVSKEHSIPGLVKAMVEKYGKPKGG
ncbi:MAG: uroporphyrinogen-III C-methyltransferase [Dehalococcoidia bacterium]|nr:uroporphyrinogen-III C-methyltransferase [Dehalococcoidia bacterium]